MAQLFAPVCSITITKRRRFFWAAWWSGPPTRVPFRRPDASDGGAATYEEALEAATRAAGTSLSIIESEWAKACIRLLRGQPAWLQSRAAERASHAKSRADAVDGALEDRQEVSVWTILGTTAHATEAELKAAFRKRALETHPDHGGDPGAFRSVVRAYTEARRRIRKPRRANRG